MKPFPLSLLHHQPTVGFFPFIRLSSSFQMWNQPATEQCVFPFTQVAACGRNTKETKDIGNLSFRQKSPGMAVRVQK